MIIEFNIVNWFISLATHGAGLAEILLLGNAVDLSTESVFDPSLDSIVGQSENIFSSRKNIQIFISNFFYYSEKISEPREIFPEQ